MDEVTPQKRVLPARERAESTSKRQATSPAATSTPATEPRLKRKYTKRATLDRIATPARGTATPSTPVEDVLPSRIQNSRPLPTTSHKQPEKLSNKEYQSIAESAVLTASLHRSRMQWLCEGIFKRYWTKPVKRKGVIEQPPNNPDSKTMTRLGNATMTIEPHVFDVTFYTVRAPSTGPPPYFRHPNQHTAKQANNPPVTPLGVRPPPPNVPSSNPGPSKSATSAPSNASPASATLVKQETTTVPSKASNSTSSMPASPAPTSNTISAVPTPPPPHPIAHAPTQSVAPAPPSKPANDPVIQMLAARAANDERLRELMKVVATSQASVDQLKEFQAHIDEFNRIIKQQEAKKAESEKAKPPPAPAAAHPATYNAAARPYPGPPTSIGGPMHMAPPSYGGYPPQRPEPFIKHIVIEFHSTTQGATTDRWLFPEYAVLDIKSGGSEMIASFFVVRSGEDILKRYGGEIVANEDSNLRQKFQPAVEYYQPVTVLVKAAQHKTIETIARAAKSLPECQSYMKEVMEKKTRAPREYLVLSLPREKALTDVGVNEFVDSAVEMSNDEDDELKDVYKA